MNLNQKVNSILGLLLIIVAFLTLGTYLFVVYQSPSELLGESVQVGSIYNSVNKDVVEDPEQFIAEKVDQYEVVCKDFNNDILAKSYLLHDKKNNKDIFRFTLDSSIYSFEDWNVYYHGNSCENKNGVVDANNIVRWNNKLVYTLLVNVDNCEEDFCNSIRQIISYDLDSGEKKVLWEKSVIEMPEYDQEGNLTGEIIEQQLFLLRSFTLFDDYLYIKVHPKNTCYACGYAPDGGFTFRINLNNPNEEELVGGIGYIGGSIMKYNDKYYIVDNACAEGGCSVSSIYLYDNKKNEIAKIGEFSPESHVSGEMDWLSARIIDFWDNYLILSEATHSYVNYKDSSTSIYKIDLSNGETIFMYNDTPGNWVLDNNNLIKYNNPYDEDFYEKGTEFEVYDLVNNKKIVDFTMPPNYSFSYVSEEDHYDGNHSGAFTKLKELGFDIEKEEIMDDYTITRQGSSNLFKYYLERN